MITRTTKIQLVLFVLITLLGVSYVSANYVGLFKGLFGSDGPVPSTRTSPIPVASSPAPMPR